ncbi:hypothetical protein BJ508DRAFT_366593 [Ascobolus immersus RN42]|uniref:Uncharacterized protein n=1 Tax=Ascobolus immersus RN42 TaxID=1160509 RepID=A0A3N4HIN9_ASCIM|nr:hypothetical protein BJ508DRAFT_366593 [Ascobolus immersus RN42]
MDTSTLDTATWPAWATETKIVQYEISSINKGFPTKAYVTAQTVFSLVYPHPTDTNGFTEFITVPATMTATLPIKGGETMTGNFIDTTYCPTETPAGPTCPKPVGLIAGIAVLAVLLAIALVVIGILLLKARKKGADGAISGSDGEIAFEGQSEFVSSSRPSEKLLASQNAQSNAELQG